MNSFSDWKGSGALHQALSGNVNEKRVNNYNSLEGALKGILGDSFGKKEVNEDANKEKLEEAQKRASELAAAADRIKELASRTERQIEETKEETATDQKYEGEEPVLEEVEPETKAYRIFRDKDENFECKISVQGAGLSSAQVRVVLDSGLWNLVFYGKLYKDGNCVVPIKKGIPLPEGTRGRARLEVVVDEQLFLPWEDDFVVEGSKKVKVELKKQKTVKVDFSKD